MHLLPSTKLIWQRQTLECLLLSWNKNKNFEFKWNKNFCWRLFHLTSTPIWTRFDPKTSWNVLFRENIQYLSARWCSTEKTEKILNQRLRRVQNLFRQRFRGVNQQIIFLFLISYFVIILHPDQDWDWSNPGHGFLSVQTFHTPKSQMVKFFILAYILALKDHWNLFVFIRIGR